MSFLRKYFLLVCSLVAFGGVRSPAFAEGLRFEIKLAESATNKPITGRLFVFTSVHAQAIPMQSLDWFHPQPFFAIDVKEFAPGETRVLDDSADGFPGKLSTIPAGNYRIQAILDHDIYYPNACDGPGNIYSEIKTLTIDPQSSASIPLEISKVVVGMKLDDSDRVKFISRQSWLLSKFYGREVSEQCAVVLPLSYDVDSSRRYPVYYEVSGFGGSLNQMTFRHMAKSTPKDEGETEFIRVMLTGQCKWGHHVYANSATNGPRGDALIQEMIPYIDSNFRTVDNANARFVGGHSSGGWSSLWLQIQYPDVFGGVWSSSPDPVDFRDWQGTDLYAKPTPSVFIDHKGGRRPLARQGLDPVIFYDSFCRMDDVLGRGGQLRSFEAVFSPVGRDGEPKRCWDRVTGEVDPDVVEAWKKYDISLILQEKWCELEEKLAGKIHIVMGDLDTFYLEGATKQLANRLRELESDADIQIVPGADHGSVLTPQVRARKFRQMSEVYLKHFDNQGQPITP
jgi:S-formylglutathione hydrolase FrmB